MTRREAAIVTAYTGLLVGSFDDFHEYAEEIMERPIFTHEFGYTSMANTIQEKSRKDFISITIED